MYPGVVVVAFESDMVVDVDRHRNPGIKILIVAKTTVRAERYQISWMARIEILWNDSHIAPHRYLYIISICIGTYARGALTSLVPVSAATLCVAVI